ncbi:glycosyltransferase family 4 protein [Methanobrevibacter sp.]|uniref:glycosyltransferase family 4 protein n=1 Tax=Methanobrevibacter sp. TaxID=66852 RepID=UPI002618E4E1|nr:glycosyltransferase [uncultured Methanobrevibacter sp.]
MDIGIVHPNLIYPRGAEKQVSKLSYYLEKMGNDVTVYTFEKSDPYYFDNELKNVEIVSLGKKWITNSKLGLDIPRWYLLSKKLSKELKNHDILNYHNSPAQWVSNFTEMKGIWTCNEPPFYHRVNNIEKYLLKPVIKFDRYMSKNIDLILSLDSKVTLDIRDRYPKKEVNIIGSSVDLDKKITHINNEFVDILSVGPISYQRHHLDIVKSISLIKDRKKFKLHFVGEVLSEKLLDEILYICKEKQIEICLYGYVTDEKLHELYNIADLSIFVPEYQPWGIFPLESMLGGIPTIISSSCGIIEIFDKETIFDFIVETGDINSLYNKIQDIIENKEYYSKKTNKISEFIRNNYSWEEYSKRVYNEFSKFLEKGN